MPRCDYTRLMGGGGANDRPQSRIMVARLSVYLNPSIVYARSQEGKAKRSKGKVISASFFSLFPSIFSLERRICSSAVERKEDVIGNRYRQLPELPDGGARPCRQHRQSLPDRPGAVRPGRAAARRPHGGRPPRIPCAGLYRAVTGSGRCRE